MATTVYIYRIKGLGFSVRLRFSGFLGLRFRAQGLR